MRLNSVTIEVADDDKARRPEPDSLQRVSLAAQGILVTFQKHQALRSIQNFTLTIATRKKYPPSRFRRFHLPDDFIERQNSLHMCRRILALTALVHCGFCESHDLEEQSVKTSADWLESTMSLTKLLPEVMKTGTVLQSCRLLTPPLSLLWNGLKKYETISRTLRRSALRSGIVYVERKKGLSSGQAGPHYQK